jgi:hypothetical protein
MLHEGPGPMNESSSRDPFKVLIDGPSVPKLRLMLQTVAVTTWVLLA